MKAFTNILVSLLMLSFAGYAVWFTYNQILLDQEQIAKDSQETQRLLQEAREYQAKIAPEIEALEKGVKQLQDELTASFGSSFSDTPVVKHTTYNKLDSELSEVESDYAKCMISLKHSDLSKKEMQFGCYEMVKAYHPHADYSGILFYINNY